MVSISRGRGRGWVLNDKNSLPKPGGSLYADDTIYTNLLNLINLVNNENLTEIIEDIAKLINENKENLKEILNKLYSYALDNIDFVMKLLLVCDYSKIRDICDSKGATLYRYLVTQYQEDYDRRKDLKKENAAQFYNRVILFSKFLSYIRYIKLYQRSSKGAYGIFHCAIIDYLELLLETASPDDVQFFTEQLIVHGQVLNTIFHNKLKDLMIIARQVLLKENLPLTSRQFLLYAVDLENRNFGQLPTNLQKFYMLQFGENFIEKDRTKSGNGEKKGKRQDGHTRRPKNKVARALATSGEVAVSSGSYKKKEEICKLELRCKAGSSSKAERQGLEKIKK